MATYTDTQLLEQVREAISVIVSGGSSKSYTVNGKSFTIQDIDKLLMLEKYYQERVDSAADTQGTSVLAEMYSS